MTRRLDLGPILAIAVAGIAIIAGFIVVGGPGHARDSRLDQLTSQRISQVVGVIQCAFDATGIAPIDYATAAETRSISQVPGQPPAICDGRGYGSGALDLRVGQGESPAAPGDITYADISPTQAKVCGNFRIKSAKDSESFSYPYSDVYPTLIDPRDAGIHCYVLDLVKSGAAFNGIPIAPPDPAAKPVP